MNIGDPWPDLAEAQLRVHRMQTKLHQWAKADPGRRFDDLFNLVYDPATLRMAFARVASNTGRYTPGVDVATAIAARDTFAARDLVRNHLTRTSGLLFKHRAGGDH